MEAGGNRLTIILFERANRLWTLYFFHNLGLQRLYLNRQRRVNRDSCALLLQPAKVQHRNQRRDGARRDHEISD